MKLRDESGKEWEIKYDTVQVPELREDFQHTVNEFKRVCDGMNLKID